MQKKRLMLVAGLLVISTIVGFFVLCGQIRADNNRRLLGMWRLVDIRSDSKVLPELLERKVDGPYRIFISANTIVFDSGSAQPEKLKYILAGEKNPQHIDLILANDERERGIYKVDDNKLMLCFPATRGGERPSAFTISSGNRIQTIFIFVRVATQD
jgi:uncharacterized protein (TIGR03067 family)